MITMHFPQLPEILNIHNAENIYTLDNLHIDRINNIIDTYSTFISRLEMFEEIQAPVLKFLKRSLSMTPERMALYPESKEEALKILKYTISSDLQIHLKMKALDLNFLYLVNTFLDNAEEQIIDSIFMPPINDIEQTDIELAMQATMPQYSPLQNRIAERDLNFLFDFKNIMQTKTQMGIFRIDQKRMNEIIVNNDERPALEEKLVFINDYLLQAVLQNITIKSLIIRDDFVVIRQLKSIFVDSELYEGINKNLETLKQEESYEDTISVKLFRNNLLNKIVSHREAITMIVNDEQIVDRIQQKDSKLIRELLVFFPDSQEQIQEIVFQNQVNIKRIFDGETDFIKDLVEIFPASQDRVQEIVFQNQATIRKIADLDIDLIKKIVKIFLDSKRQLEEIIFENPNIKNKIFPENFKVIKELIELFPTSKQNIIYIIFQNPDNNIKMLELDLNFKNQLLNMSITLEEISIIFLSNQKIANRMSNLDYDFIERCVNFFPNTEHKILNNILQNSEMRNVIELLDFYSLHQFPEFFLNSFKNQLLDRLLDSQIIKLSLANLNEKNINILTHFKDNVYELFDFTTKEKSRMPEIFLQEVIDSNNNFHEQLLQLNINNINRLKNLFYLDNKKILLNYFNAMFFKNEDFYRYFSISYLNIIQKVFLDKININDRNYYLGSEIVNDFAYNIFYNKEKTIKSNKITQQILEVNIDLIYNLNNFFESMLDYNDRFPITVKYYYFQYECISQLCKSEVFIDRMSKEPDLILKLDCIFNRDNNSFVSDIDSLNNYRCSMQTIIQTKLMKNIATQNTVIQNILNKTFLDNLEMFLINVSRNSLKYIEEFKKSFLLFNSDFISKTIKESPLTDELIDFINNLKVFFMEDEVGRYAGNFIENKFLLQLKEEDQKKMKNDLIITQKYLISNTQKTFIKLYTEHLFIVKKQIQNILYLNMVASERAAHLELYKNLILVNQILELDKQVEALNHSDVYILLTIRKMFQIQQNIQKEELVLQNMRNKSLQEQEEILVKRKQELEEQQQEEEQLYNLMRKMVVKDEERQITEEQEQLIQRILANAPQTFAKQPEPAAIVTQVKQAKQGREIKDLFRKRRDEFKE